MLSIAKLMQLVGLTIPPVAILYQLTSNDAHSLGIMLVLTLFAIALFYVGRMLEGMGRKP